MLNIARIPDNFRIITSDKEVIDAKVEIDWVKEEYPDLMFGFSHKMV